jgi:hypothetical protein
MIRGAAGRPDGFDFLGAGGNNSCSADGSPLP